MAWCSNFFLHRFSRQQVLYQDPAAAEPCPAIRHVGLSFQLKQQRAGKAQRSTGAKPRSYLRTFRRLLSSSALYKQGIQQTNTASARFCKAARKSGYHGNVKKRSPQRSASDSVPPRAEMLEGCGRSSTRMARALSLSQNLAHTRGVAVLLRLTAPRGSQLTAEKQVYPACN